MSLVGMVQRLADAGLGKTVDRVVEDGGGLFTLLGAMGGFLGGGAAGAAAAAPVTATPAAPAAPTIVMVAATIGLFAGARVGHALDALVFDDADIETAMGIVFAPIDT